MKARCVAGTDSGYYFEFSGEQPKEGVEYILEDATNGTQDQNKAFHALLNAFWAWMNKTDTFIFQDGNRIFDLSTPSAGDFREFFKYKYGAGFSHLEYVDENYEMKRVKDFSEIPAEIIESFNSGVKGRIKGVLKSWSKYNKKERRETIDNLLMIISLSGCDSKKVREIIEGMEK